MSPPPLAPFSSTHLPSAQRGFLGGLPGQTDPTPADAPLLALALTGALDELACGIMVVDAQARLVHANAAAYAVVARGEAISIEHGIVTVATASDAHSLKDALAKAAQGKRSMIALGPLARTTVAVVPLRSHGAGAVGSASDASFAAAQAPAHYTLMFSRVSVCEALMLSFFSRAHRLTAAEEQILALMCAGLTAPEMAQRLHVGQATVRTHVRNICAKTHSNGIRDVVKRLAVLPPIMTAALHAA